MNDMFITSAAELRQCLPNQMAPAMGDPDLFDKLQPYLLEAQGWVDAHLATVEMTGQRPTLRTVLRTVVAARALHSAVGALDVVLTANGFGVINTDTIAPASRERVDAVRRDLQRLGDAAVWQAIRTLRKDDIWRKSEQCGNWTKCLLSPINSEFDAEGYFSVPKYIEQSARRAEIENGIAEKVLSYPVLADLRRDVLFLPNEHDFAKIELIQMVNSLVDKALGKENHRYPFRRVDLLDIIDILRKNPDQFPSWRTSRQAQRAEGLHFRNSKKSSGFFF